jgi:hypothetical protein
VRRPRRRSAGSLAVSIAIHVVAVTVLFQIVFSYPLGQLVGIPRENRPEQIRFVTVAPRATESSLGGSAPSQSAPAALAAPVQPSAVIPAPVIDSARSRAAGGRGTGIGGTGSGVASGVVPTTPDARIELEPSPLMTAPHSVAYDVDSIVTAVIGVYLDSMVIASKQRKPGDWTVKGEDGKVWGWDQKGIHLGKFTIPQALLALLPLNTTGPSPIDVRNASMIRAEVLENSRRAITEDEFRTAVKRIRARKDRERQQRLLANGQDTLTRSSAPQQ